MYLEYQGFISSFKNYYSDNKINEDDLLTLDDIIRVLPSGKCDIDEEYHQRRKYEKN